MDRKLTTPSTLGKDPHSSDFPDVLGPAGGCERRSFDGPRKLLADSPDQIDHWQKIPTSEPIDYWAKYRSFEHLSQWEGCSIMPINADQGAAPFVPAGRTLPVLQEAVQDCRGCDLYKNATQAVFGELETGAKTKKPKVAIMMIGEQPGDQEDKQGRPFVGPAGKLLDRCLEEAGIERGKVYVTNTVKHFRWKPRGKLRIHKKPSMREIHACRPWLEAELEAVHPEMIVCLGATAAQSLLGSGFKITQSHGKVREVEGFPPIIASLHPSAILRARTDSDRRRDTKILMDDLRRVKQFLQK